MRTRWTFLALVFAVAFAGGAMGLLFVRHFAVRDAIASPQADRRDPSRQLDPSAEIERLRKTVAHLEQRLAAQAAPAAQPETAVVVADSLERAHLSAVPQEALPAVLGSVIDFGSFEFTEESLRILGITREQLAEGSRVLRNTETRLREIELQHVLRRESAAGVLTVTVAPYAAETASALETLETELARSWSPQSMEWLRATGYRSLFLAHGGGETGKTYTFGPDPDDPGWVRLAVTPDGENAPKSAVSSEDPRHLTDRYGPLLGLPPGG